uniref:Metalloendopeptidase n=1 Tax=Strongyloides stercoralis TaxID=6248 RepID=A0AAF5D1C7_STRER
MIRNHPQAKWNFPIPYFVDRGVSKFLVDRALLLIEKDTCIKFENYRRIIPGMAGLHYFYGIGCNSHVGKLGRRTWQLISIGYGCDLIGRIQHETFHALGLYHTHSRHDRDQYLYFNLENVDINAHNNFEMVPQEDSLTFSVPFDFGSLMMYARKGFSSNGRDTILSHDYHYRNTYGSLQKPSFADLKMLNFLYCSKKCSIKLTCFNGGYQDPNNCSTCKCVDGFIGSFCSMYSRSTKECKTSKLFATNKIKEFGTTGKKNCIYHILASKNQKIAIKVIDTYFFPNGQHICYEKNSLEIKYWNDKVATGARKKRMITGVFNEKWTFPIPYFIDSGVSHFKVYNALHLIERETCIRFKKYKKKVRSVIGLRYYFGKDCSSLIGRQKNFPWQPISIGPGCDKLGRIQHETLHALGLYHLHSRKDRDNYVYFLKENIDGQFYDNFRKVTKIDSKTFHIPFDFASVMMYGPRSYSKNNGDTMLPYDFRYKHTYGVVDHITFADTKMLNLFYCSKNCKIKIKCANGGYQDPNNCKKCKCVKGFIGPFCSMLSLPTNECGSSRLLATNNIKILTIKGKKNCVYHILSDKDKKIAIKILYGLFLSNKEYPCPVHNSLEIKYWISKIPTGARKMELLNFSFVDVVIKQKQTYSALRNLEMETCIKFKKLKTMVPGFYELRYYYGTSPNSPIGKPTEKN